MPTSQPGAQIPSLSRPLLSFLSIHDIFDPGHDDMGLDLCNAGAFYQGNIKYIIGILVVIQPMNHCLC